MFVALCAAVIAISLAWNGANREGIRVYERWWSNNPIGPKALVSGALMSVWRFSFCIAVILATGRRVFKRAQVPLRCPISDSSLRNRTAKSV
jgi:hypothetical protein